MTVMADGRQHRPVGRRVAASGISDIFPGEADIMPGGRRMTDDGDDRRMTDDGDNGRMTDDGGRCSY